MFLFIRLHLKEAARSTYSEREITDYDSVIILFQQFQLLHTIYALQRISYIYHPPERVYIKRHEKKIIKDHPKIINEGYSAWRVVRKQIKINLINATQNMLHEQRIEFPIMAKMVHEGNKKCRLLILPNWKLHEHGSNNFLGKRYTFDEKKCYISWSDEIEKLSVGVERLS